MSKYDGGGFLKTDKYISDFSLRLYIIFQKHPFLRKLKIIMYFVDSFLLIFIKKPKVESKVKKQVLIIYNFAFGDGVIWLCSMQKIRELYPENKYEISLVCQKGLNSLYESTKLFDKVFPCNLTEATFNLFERYKLFKFLREKYYDIVLDPIGVSECTTNIFVSRALEAREKITVQDTTLKTKYCPKWLTQKIYSKIINIDEPNLSLIEFYSSFIRGLGLTDFKVSFIKPDGIKPKIRIPSKYFIVFPSASTFLKCWPIDRYAEIAKKIYRKTGLTLLLCGTEKDRKIIEDFICLLGKEVPYENIVGKTTLLEFIDVVEQACLVITNDTSTYHIATISQVPVAIITGGYTYNRYVLYKFEREEEFRKPCQVLHKMSCFDCDNKCPFMNRKSKLWPCLEKVSTEYAWQKIEELINDSNIGRK